jgi:hypothetical protein
LTHDDALYRKFQVKVGFTSPITKAGIFPVLALFAVVITLTGCADTQLIKLDATARPPTAQVDIFKARELPPHAFKVIAELSWKGPRSDELRAESHFLKQARKLGGNALLIEEAAGGTFSGPRVRSADGITWNVPDNNTWLFKAKVAVYQ